MNFSRNLQLPVLVIGIVKLVIERGSVAVGLESHSVFGFVQKTNGQVVEISQIELQ